MNRLFDKTKPVYDAYRKAGNKKQCRAAHEGSIILHEATATAWKAAGIDRKIPSVAVLQADYAKLQG